MARSRIAILLAGARAGVSIGAIGVATVACVPKPAPDVSAPDYALCNSTGCGDNVAIVVDKGK